MKVIWKGPGCLKKIRKVDGPLRDNFIYPGEEVKEGDVSGERIDQLIAAGHAIPAPVEPEAQPKAVEPEAQPKAAAAGPKKRRR